MEKIFKLKGTSPIVEVNQKYPDGWYCLNFDVVYDDILSQLEESDLKYWDIKSEYVGYIKCKNFNGFNGWNKSYDRILPDPITKITPEEYLIITGRTPRDYNLVKFKWQQGDHIFTLLKNEDSNYSILRPDGSIFKTQSQSQIEENFKSFDWIEIKAEQNKVMKRFLLFAYDNKSTIKGWNNFINSFETEEEAKLHINYLNSNHLSCYDNYHIVDSNFQLIIYTQ